MVDTALARLIADELALPLERVVPSAEFVALGADSLDIVELAMRVEVAFDVVVSDDEAEGCVSVGDAIDLVRAKLRLRQAARVAPARAAPARVAPARPPHRHRPLRPTHARRRGPRLAPARTASSGAVGRRQERAAKTVLSLALAAVLFAPSLLLIELWGRMG